MAVFGVYAQYIEYGLSLQQSKRTPLVTYFPYSTVQVVDNRPDTSKVYIAETGTYPVHYVTFTEPASVVIKRYIDSAVLTSRKGSGQLLINIEQLNIPNIKSSLKIVTPKFTKRKVIMPLQVRDYVQFQITAWYKNEQGNYNKLLTVKRQYPYTNGLVGSSISRLLDNCIKAISFAGPDPAIDKSQLNARQKRFLNNNNLFIYANGEDNIPFEQINVNVRNSWKNYPVIKDSCSVAGISFLFDDFKNNQVSPANIQLVFSEKDSLYRVKCFDSLFHNKQHWGVYDGVNWYIRLADSSYFKLTKCNDTYGFYIPRNMPDMYALLSMQVNYMQSSSYAGGGGDNFPASLIGILLAGAIDQSITNKANKMMIRNFTAEGLKHNYRYCTLKMDNGDIMYQNK